MAATMAMPLARGEARSLNGHVRQERPGVVARPRLAGRLLESTHVPLALVVAPAGFGKTTLISQWEDQDPRPFRQVALQAGADGAACLTASIAALERSPGVLVVDDEHLHGDRAALDAIASALDRLPAGSQIVLASRCEPALPVGRLRAQRRLLEVRSPDLAMTRSEATALFDMAGLRLAPGEVDALVSKTEGWPVGLYLAALALHDEPDAGTAVAAFTGGDRMVAEYIREELLSQVSDEERDFLVRTSVLDSLSGPACDAVLERSGSSGLLADLARSNLLIVPLDRTGERYRYHALLAETLRNELRRLEPERERELHRLASRWHAEHDEADRAIDHAIAAGDADAAGTLLWEHVPRYLSRGRVAAVLHWLEGFTDDEIAHVPALALAAAAAHLTAGDGNQLRHWTAVASAGMGRAASGESEKLEAGLAVMLAAGCDDLPPAPAERASHAYRLEPEDSPWRALCCLFGGAASQLGGDRDRARRVLQEGAGRGATGAPSVQTLCLAQLALMALDEDDLESAEAAVDRALGQVERLGIADYPTQASVFAVSALVRAARGRVEDAGRDLRHSQGLLAMLIDFLPWYGAQVRVTLARAALKLSDVPKARALLAEAAPLLRQVPDAVVLGGWVDDARRQADAASDSAAAGGWVLTTAELRVLQFLPSHLSFPEVAEQLCVSPNTVKSHARAVYRKLNATSRAEAVDRARDCGLLV